MRLTLLSVAFVLMTNQAVAQQGNERTYSFPVSDPDSPIMLEVDLRHGRLSVNGGDFDKVEVIAKTRPLREDEMDDVRVPRRVQTWTEKGEAERTPRSRVGLKPVRNSMLNMEIDQDGNNIDISTEESTYYVDLVINVPQSTNVEADMYRGDGIIVSNTRGYLELESWRGDIVAEGIRGPIVAETHQNAIVVSFAEFSSAGPSSLATHSGDIDITVANSMSANINVQNYQGEVLSGLNEEFVPTEQVKRKEGSDRQEIIIGGQLTATLNQGGQDLTLATYNGDVYVRRPQ
jgi:hypothetical protein